MSARFRSALSLPILLSTLNVQISLIVMASQSNSQPISLDAASVAQFDNSPRPHLSDYPIGSVENYLLPVQPNQYSEEASHSGDRLLQTSPIRSQLVQETLEDKRAFKFGKRSLQPAVDDEFTGIRNKMAFKFGKKWDANEPRFDFDEADKRAFKFGKKSHLEPLGSDIDMKREGFKFGKRGPYISSYLPETYEFVDPKRAFKFGKRLYSDDDIPKRAMFKFGKRSDNGEQNSNIGSEDTFSFSRLPSILEASDLVKYDKFRPLEKGQNPQDIDEKRAFKFGRRSSSEDWEQQVKHQQQLYQQRMRDKQRGSDMRRLFKLGKKSLNDEDQAYDDNLMNEETNELNEMKRQFKFGK